MNGDDIVKLQNVVHTRRCTLPLVMIHDVQGWKVPFTQRTEESLVNGYVNDQ